MMNAVLESHDPADLGERLRHARSQAGLTQEQAASALQVARTTLVAIEKGQRRVRPDELRELSRVYGLPVGTLLRASAVRVDLVPRFRALREHDDAGTAYAARLLNDLVAAEVELEGLVGRPLKTNYPAERPLLPGDIREQAEDLALEMRHRLGIGLAPVADIVSLLELEVGMRIFVRPIPDAAVSGLFIYDEAVGACVLLNKNHSRERRTVTAAHEFGHLTSARRQPDVVDTKRGPQSREERFATAFSLAFMMPAAVVRRRFHESQQEAGRFSPRHLILMAHGLNVSQEAMCRRLEDLKLLPGGTWESLRDRGFSGELVRKVLGDRPVHDDLIVPPRLWMLAAEAYRRELLTEGQLAQLLRMERVELRRLIDVLGDEDDHDLESLAVV